MKDAQECIDEIGQSGSTLFTTNDLTAGFFSGPGKGQFQWVTTPMGLLGAPASFQRLMEKVVEDIHNTQVYINDLLCPMLISRNILPFWAKFWLDCRDTGSK